MPRAGTKKKKRWKWPAKWLPTRSYGFLVALGALLTAALLMLLEPYVWLGSVLHELGFHLALTAAVVAVIALLKRAFLAALVACVLAAAFVAPLVPLYRDTRPTPRAGPLLHVATAHVAGQTLTRGRLAAWLAQSEPDALALTGLAPGAELGTRLGAYRGVRGKAEPHALLWVRSALAVGGAHEAGHPTQVLRAGRCRARMVAVELPRLAAYTELTARARAIRALDGAASAPRSVWLGHFGSRADAHDLAPFRAHHALRDGRRGHGRTATAPSALGPLGFPLSYVLVHGWIGVRALSAEEPLVAGAHRTVRATLELTEPRCRARVARAEVLEGGARVKDGP